MNLTMEADIFSSLNIYRKLPVISPPNLFYDEKPIYPMLPTVQ